MCTVLWKIGKDIPSYCDRYKSPCDTNKETPTILRKYRKKIKIIDEKFTTLRKNQYEKNINIETCWEAVCRSKMNYLLNIVLIKWPNNRSK